jgi:hypothetical protein
VAEGARLESEYRVKPIGGSNPPLSATDKKARQKCLAFLDSKPCVYWLLEFNENNS